MCSETFSGYLFKGSLYDHFGVTVLSWDMFRSVRILSPNLTLSKLGVGFACFQFRRPQSLLMEHPSSPVFLTAEWCRNVIGELLDRELLEYIGTVSVDIVLVR